MGGLLTAFFLGGCCFYVLQPWLVCCGFLFVPWLLISGSTALCGRHLLLSVATKVSKSALLFHHRSTNKSAVAVKFSAPVVDLILKFIISSNRFNKIQLLLTEISHYYSSALLKQLTNRFDKNNLSTSTDRYRPWCTSHSVMV